MKVSAQLVVPKVEDGSLRIAFATKDGINVDGHFGWASAFAFYDVSAEKITKAGKIVFSSEELDERGNDDKLPGKIEALEGCHIVYSQAIGGPAAARLTRKKIQPLVVKDESRIEKLLEDFRKVLNGSMPPWLRKLVKKDDPERFSGFDEDDEE
ncbi:MAG: nitrogen fixation protein NifX [bacterium]|nr:MAG: nitrogen fixation protein NifX [bacterium]